MELPKSLDLDVQVACLRRGLATAELLRSLRTLTSHDDYIAHWVWDGGGFGQENLTLDVYVLGRVCLYNLLIMDERTQTAVAFLEDIDTLALAEVPHEKSPYMLLLFRAGNEASRIFGGGDDLRELEDFREQVLQACITARGKKE